MLTDKRVRYREHELQSELACLPSILLERSSIFPDKCMEKMEMKTVFSCLCVAVLLSAYCSGTINGKTLFEDDFEGDDFAAKWDIVAGNWEVREIDGNHAVWHDGGGSETIVIKDMVFDDFIVEMRILHVSDSAGAHIYFRTNEGPDNDSGDGYLHGEDAGINVIRWFRVTAGSPAVQEELNDIDITPDTWTWFKVRMENNRAEMWYRREGKDDDYILAYEANDLDEYDEGGIGTWVGGEVLFDDVLVTDLEGAPVEPGGKLANIWGKIKSRH